MTPLGWLLIAVGTAAAVLLYTFRHRPGVREHLGPQTPAGETSPRVAPAPAVETPEAGAVTPPAAPASGTPSTFEDHVEQALAIANGGDLVEVWCGCCGEHVLVPRGEAVAHIISHYEPFPVRRDFQLWEAEVSAS